MTKKSAGKRPKGHQNLGPDDTIRLWVAAGGRCELCLKLLNISDKSWLHLNLSERAHIIGQGDGAGSPRYDPVLSPQLANSLDNVMLLCFDCHKEIDDKQTRDRYTPEVLQKMKAAHEDRIRYLTSLEAERTRVIVFQTRIQQNRDGELPGQTNPVLHRADLYDAILPDYYPDQQEPSRISIELPTAESPEHWNQLLPTIKKKWERLDADEIPHLSVFSLGKIPAIVHLGRLVGDARKVRTMNVQQGVATRWTSDDQIPSAFEYVVTSPKKSKPAADVLLLISLSGQIEEKQYVGVVSEDMPCYQISHTLKPLTPDWLIAEKQVKDFRKIYRDLLSSIQETHGQEATIHLLIAAPTAIVFEIGRQYRPNHHPKVIIYNCVGRQFQPAFQLGEHT